MKLGPDIPANYDREVQAFTRPDQFGWSPGERQRIRRRFWRRSRLKAKNALKKYERVESAELCTYYAHKN